MGTVTSKYAQSAALFDRGQQSLVGAVNSPVRAFNSVGGNPIFIDHAKGPYIYDVDNNEYLDFVCSYGPMILGHVYPSVQEAIVKATEKGYTFGASTQKEIELAELVKEAFPSMDKVRFVNSGTEAVLSAIRLARGFTKRNKIIKFAGCYHGHTDALLVAAGSGLVTAGLPGSAGVPKEAVKDTLVALYNDIDSVKTLFNQFPEEIGGVIIEPVAGNMGVIVPENNFLKDLETLCHQNGALLILDEVMTGFRSKFGGAQDSFDVTGDITCMGKVIGGGLPVGAYGGKAQIMDCLAPLGEVYQAGTLSGNPIAMTAGIETLKVLRDTNPYQNLEATAIEIEDALFHAAKAKGIALTTNRFGSMINPFFTQGPVSNFEHAQQCDTEQFAKFFWGLMDNGMYIPPSQYEAWFLNNALSPQDIDKACEAITKAIQNL